MNENHMVSFEFSSLKKLPYKENIPPRDVRDLTECEILTPIIQKFITLILKGKYVISVTIFLFI